MTTILRRVLAVIGGAIFSFIATVFELLIPYVLFPSMNGFGIIILVWVLFVANYVLFFRWVIPLYGRYKRWAAARPIP